MDGGYEWTPILDYENDPWHRRNSILSPRYEKQSAAD